MIHDNITRLQCACGQFHLSVRGSPITTAECHCNSCREVAERLAEMPEPVSTQTADGGTRYVMYRKDRVDFPHGVGLLRQFRLSPKASTRRVLTSCCQTPVFLEFKGSHWLSLYDDLWRDQPHPTLKLRTMTGDAISPVPSDVPSGGLATTRFYANLLGAWIAMGLKVPAVPVEGDIAA